MFYVDVVNKVFQILFGLTSLLYCHFIIFGIVGLFGRKTYPKAEKKLKYGLIIPARNEEKVVGNLIKSIQQNKYPQEKLHIFVIAHNCTDRTAEIARELGATVYEYNNPNECTMGYAFRYLFDQINKDYGTQNYDGFFLFNADNVLSTNYFEKMNDAFVACNKECIITSYRNSKNFGSNLMSGLYGLYFITGCRFEMRGRTILNCSTRVAGTGYVINSKLVKDGWKYVTLTEDWEFSADQIISGNKIKYCNDAEFFDEQPTSFKVMWRQRLRWSRGHLLVCVTRLRDLVNSFFSHKKEHKLKGSIYDYTMNVLPFCVILTFMTIAQVILLLFSPLAGANLGVVLLGWLKAFGISCLITYLTTFVQGVLVFIVERKRIHGVSFGKKVLLSFIWPLFIMIQFAIDIVALFSKNLGWKTIPHNDTTSIDNINSARAKQSSAETTSVDAENSEM